MEASEGKTLVERVLDLVLHSGKKLRRAVRDINKKLCGKHVESVLTQDRSLIPSAEKSIPIQLCLL